jgi:hypothetical protein
MFSLINIIAFILCIYVIYSIVEMCKSQYMESFTNINNDKNWFIIIFKQFIFAIIAMMLYVVINDLQNNHPVKTKKFGKIVPI